MRGGFHGLQHNTDVSSGQGGLSLGKSLHIQMSGPTGEGDGGGAVAPAAWVRKQSLTVSGAYLRR